MNEPFPSRPLSPYLQPAVRRRTGTTVMLVLLALLALALVAALAQGLALLPNLPVDLVIDGERVAEGVNLAELSTRQRWTIALAIAVSLLVVAVVVPVAIGLTLLAVVLSVVLALGAVGVALAVGLAPLALLVLPFVWLWRRSTKR